MTHVVRNPDLAMGGGGVLLLLVALLLLAGAFGWRYAQSVGVRHKIRQALTDPDPEVRRHGIALATDRGLAWAADLLLRIARDERDPAVLATLVEAVARRQWEPASTARIVELRLWAKAYVDSHEELRSGYQNALDQGDRQGRGTAAPAPSATGSTPGGTSAPAANAAGTEPTYADRPARRASDATDADLAALGVAGAPRPAAGSQPEPAGSGPARVLVTGAGGPAGVAVIRDLLAHGHHVVAVDADPTAVGLRLAHDGRPVPRADDPGYADALLDVVAATEPAALVCTVAEEYAALVPLAARLADAGVATLMPSLAAVEACIDKWRFAEVAAEHGLPVPPTALGEVDGMPGPWVVKPRRGRGSRDVRVVTAEADLLAALRAAGEPIVQPLLTGREFTADALVDRDGTVVAVVPRWRLETKAGISTKGTTFADPTVEAAVARVLEAVGLVGPANVQGFVADDGTVSVHEVNPRFSGGLPLSLHAGADLVEEYVRAVLGHPVRGDRLVARPGVSMFRHFAEVFEG